MPRNFEYEPRTDGRAPVIYQGPIFGEVIHRGKIDQPNRDLTAVFRLGGGELANCGGLVSLCCGAEAIFGEIMDDRGDGRVMEAMRQKQLMTQPRGSIHCLGGNWIRIENLVEPGRNNSKYVLAFYLLYRSVSESIFEEEGKPSVRIEFKIEAAGESLKAKREIILKAGRVKGLSLFKIGLDGNLMTVAALGTTRYRNQGIEKYNELKRILGKKHRNFYIEILEAAERLMTRIPSSEELKSGMAPTSMRLSRLKEKGIPYRLAVWDLYGISPYDLLVGPQTPSMDLPIDFKGSMG